MRGGRDWTGRMGFVCFLWTVVTHGLEVSFKDMLGTWFIVLYKNTVNTRKKGNKMLAQKNKPIKSCRWFLNRAHSSYSLWVLTWMDPASSFSLFYPCRDQTCKESLGKNVNAPHYFFVSILYKNNKIIKNSKCGLLQNKNKNNECSCSVVVHRNAFYIWLAYWFSHGSHYDDTCSVQESKRFMDFCLPKDFFSTRRNVQ